MKRDGKTARPLTITLIAVLALLLILLVANGSKVANWVENGLATVLTPVEGAAAKASDAIVGFFKRVFNTTDADVENERLRAELALQEQMKTELEELRKENERLSGLLN